MIRLTDTGVFISPNGEIPDYEPQMKQQLKFDALVSPDNNYVSILQIAAASGVEEFPVPYVLSN